MCAKHKVVYSQIFFFFLFALGEAGVFINLTFTLASTNIHE